MSDENVRPDSIEASIRSIERKEDDLVVVVRLSNTASRALHYICDVRATRYDPETKTLTVAMSDEGRQVIPGAMSKLPEIRYVDPNGEAEFRVRVPEKMVKLSRSAPPGELAFETHRLSEAESLVVEVGWSDVPYYKDTRERAATKEARLPAARWEQHKARTRTRMPPGEKG